MTPSEVAALLTYAAAFDNRTPSESAARAWADALDERMTLTDAKAIVRDHYADTTEWVMPAHINRANRALRDKRLTAVGNGTPAPPGLDTAKFLEFERAWRKAIGDGHNPTQAEAIACQQVGHNPATRELSADPERAQALINQLVKELP